MSLDHPSAHDLTNHMRHPSPAPGVRSPGALAKASRRSACGGEFSSVTDRYHRKVAQDTLNGNEEQDRFLAVRIPLEK